jgi:ADP-heptose:LPS heptosyltransferase
MIKPERILVNCAEGIGDNLYARPFVRMLAQIGHEVYVKTVLPFIYADLHVKLLDPGIAKYRTQLKSQSRVGAFSREFSVVPAAIDRVIDFKYSGDSLRRASIIGHMEQAFGFKHGSTKPYFNMPKGLEHHPIKLTGKPLAVIRPVTIRKEWACETRAPNPNYIGWCSRILQNSGYEVISIADCVQDEEWIEGSEPVADLKLHHGELSIEQTLTLINQAKIVVGGSGFIIPATVSSCANLFVIFGGRGAYDTPDKVFDLRMDMKRVGWAMPDNFCRCTQMVHDCDKTITNLDDRFFSFMGQIC